MQHFCILFSFKIVFNCTFMFMNILPYQKCNCVCAYIKMEDFLTRSLICWGVDPEMYTLLTVIITSPEVRYKEILVLRKFEWHCCLQEVSRCLDNSPVINPLLSARLFSSTQHTHEPKSCSALMLLSTLLFCEQGEETQSIHHPKFNYPLTDNKPLGRRIMLEWIERKEREGGYLDVKPKSFIFFSS